MLFAFVENDKGLLCNVICKYIVKNDKEMYG